MSRDEKVVYLTFDDGPIPGVTETVLDILDEYDAKATFFCIGKNVREHSGIYTELEKRGHTVGNHTENHMSSWKVDKETYIKDVEDCGEVVGSNLFRPPYGKLKPKHYNALKKDYKIVLWDVLSGDFDIKVNGETCAANVLKAVEAGSIIVFHDSEKAKDRVLTALPIVLKELKEQGYAFKNMEGV